MAPRSKTSAKTATPAVTATPTVVEPVQETVPETDNGEVSIVSFI